MSQFLNFAGNQGTTFKNHGTGGGTSFTLDVNATTNSVLLAVGGVLQEPGVDYTVSGTTVTTTTSVTAGIEVFSWVIHKPGTAPVIQDNSVDGAKIALTSQAEGDIAYCNASGDWVRLAKGTAGQVLKQNSGLTAPEWGTEAGGAWELISHTARTTDAANVDFTWTTGVATSYSVIKIHAYDLSHDTDSSTSIRMRVYENTTLNTSTYRYNSNGYYSNATTIGQSNSNAGTYIPLTPEAANFYSDQNNVARYEITIQGEASAGSGSPRVLWTGDYSNSAFNNAHSWGGALSLGAGYPCTGVRFYASTGNIGVGATIIGLKQS